jgi:hypothetical protein
MKPVRASKKEPCPVCGKKGWPCYQTASREVAFCESVASDAVDKSGQLYRHFLVEKNPSDWKPRPAPQPSSAAPATPSALASPEHLNLVYMAVLNRLGLSPERRAELRARGLNEKAIEAGQY